MFTSGLAPLSLVGGEIEGFGGVGGSASHMDQYVDLLVGGEEVVVVVVVLELQFLSYLILPCCFVIAILQCKSQKNRRRSEKCLAVSLRKRYRNKK